MRIRLWQLLLLVAIAAIGIAVHRNREIGNAIRALQEQCRKDHYAKEEEYRPEQCPGLDMAVALVRKLDASYPASTAMLQLLREDKPHVLENACYVLGRLPRNETDQRVIEPLVRLSSDKSYHDHPWVGFQAEMALVHLGRPEQK